jgi:DNA-binding response OmpR family regulator
MLELGRAGPAPRLQPLLRRQLNVSTRGERALKILAVDDDQHFLDLLVAVLGDAGYRDVECAGSAEEALKVVNQEEADFDCFLLDVEMPDINGVELCQNLRATLRFRATPIIMVTALHQKSLIQQCFDAGATDFLNKPLDGLELGARIRMARMLNDSLNSREQLTMSEFSVSCLTENHAPETDQLPSMEKVQGLTNSHVIENHMLRNRSGYYILHVLGFKVQGFDALAETLSPKDCGDVLGDAAQAISKSLKNYEFSFAYLGGGRFISLVQGRRFWSTVNVIDEILHALRIPRANSLSLHGASVGVTSLSDRRFWTATQTADAIRAYRTSSAQFDETTGRSAQVEEEPHPHGLEMSEI